MGEAEGLSKTCDVITACASKWVREVAREHYFKQGSQS
jgi:hypothetical protein